MLIPKYVTNICLAINTAHLFEHVAPRPNSHARSRYTVHFKEPDTNICEATSDRNAPSPYFSRLRDDFERGGTGIRSFSLRTPERVQGQGQQVPVDRELLEDHLGKDHQGQRHCIQSRSNQPEETSPTGNASSPSGIQEATRVVGHRRRRSHLRCSK